MIAAADFRPGDAHRATQCMAVLGALRTGPKGTAELHGLKILSPAARIMDLRRQGFDIVTHRRGRAGLYVLREVKP